jgi:sugar lactone lactonase YvrE
VTSPQAALGECPIWDERTETLIWVDIEQGTLWRRGSLEKPVEETKLETPIGAVALREQGGLLLALQVGLATFNNGPSAAPEIQLDLRLAQSVRVNDGKVDSVGRFWFGTTSSTQGAGCLYCLEPDWSLRIVLPDITVSNGLGWSPDGATMYHIDSDTYGVDAFDFDSTTGALSNRRRLLEDKPKVRKGFIGQPDGMTIDENGHLWIAFWGTGTVRRYSPAGALEEVIEVPASQVTSCTFGDADLRTLYITTDSRLLPHSPRGPEPLAGALFSCRPGVQGLPPGRFAG